MAIVSLDMACPHCSRENAVLEGVSEVWIPSSGLSAITFLCRSCTHLVVAETRISNYYKSAGGLIRYCTVNNQDMILSLHDNLHGHIVEFYPEHNTPSAPYGVPDRVAKFFVEAKENLMRGKFETSVGLSRKVIDLATHHLGVSADISVNNLSSRINRLKEKNMLTADMADWAHIVRLDGNESVHTDEEFTEQEAKEILDFTETFLLYSFTLPSMVLSRRSDTPGEE